MTLTKRTACLLLFIFLSIGGRAQGFDDDVNDVPLDGGLSLLIAAGVGYGAKKMHEHNRKKKTGEGKE